MKLIYNKQSFATDAKRFYVPGLTLEHDCLCGNHIVLDFSKQAHLMYPYINDFTEVFVYCDECQAETPIEIELTLEVKIKE